MCFVTFTVLFFKIKTPKSKHTIDRRGQYKIFAPVDTYPGPAKGDKVNLNSEMHGSAKTKISVRTKIFARAMQV